MQIRLFAIIARCWQREVEESTGARFAAAFDAADAAEPFDNTLHRWQP
ncbi:MAG: hypothetical protein ACK4SA_07880 [Caldilinea sp.]